MSRNFLAFVLLFNAPLSFGTEPAARRAGETELRAAIARALPLIESSAREFTRQRECFSCHQRDTGGHKYPLTRQGNDTCTYCHAVAGTLEHQHEGLVFGRLDLDHGTYEYVTSSVPSSTSGGAGPSSAGGPATGCSCHTARLPSSHSSPIPQPGAS